jgi:hypothetical protein
MIPEKTKRTASIVTHCMRKLFLGLEIRLIIFVFRWVSQHHLAVREGRVFEELIPCGKTGLNQPNSPGCRSSCAFPADRQPSVLWQSVSRIPFRCVKMSSTDRATLKSSVTSTENREFRVPFMAVPQMQVSGSALDKPLRLADLMI